MNRDLLTLIGIADALIHVIESDRIARKSPDAISACDRLERIRKSLLTEGIRYSRTLGAGRDTIFEVATQFSGLLAAKNGARDVERLLNGLVSANIQEIDPPPLPSSSSSSSSTGPKSINPEVQTPSAKRAKALAESAATPSGVGKPGSVVHAGVKVGQKKKMMTYPDGKTGKV